MASIGVQIDEVNPVHAAFAALVTPPVPPRLRAVLHYHYHATGAGASPEPVRDEIWLDPKPRGFAPSKLQFICPDCGRRVADLYLRDRHFRCRRCCQLGYQSQRHSRETRGLAKAARIKRQLGGTGEYAEPVPERPKGMHRRTYERLCQAVADAEAPWEEGLLWKIARRLTRSGLLPEGDQTDLAHTARAAKRALRKPETRKRRRQSRGRPRAGTRRP